MSDEFMPKRFSKIERFVNFLLQKNPQTERIITLNCMIPKNNLDNSINTKKYNLLNFLPNFLF